MAGVALVYFGLKYAEFLEYTPIEFNKLLIIKNEANEIKDKKDMEIMRLQTFNLVNIQLAKKDRYKSLHSFMPFAWEESEKQDTEGKEMTEADWEELDKNFPGKK